MKIIVEMISDAIVPQNIMLGSTRDERLVERRFHGKFHNYNSFTGRCETYPV